MHRHSDDLLSVAKTSIAAITIISTMAAVTAIVAAVNGTVPGASCGTIAIILVTWQWNNCRCKKCRANKWSVHAPVEWMQQYHGCSSSSNRVSRKPRSRSWLSESDEIGVVLKPSVARGCAMGNAPDSAVGEVHRREDDGGWSYFDGVPFCGCFCCVPST